MKDAVFVVIGTMINMMMMMMMMMMMVVNAIKNGVANDKRFHIIKIMALFKKME